jgi:hypothetical protein
MRPAPSLLPTVALAALCAVAFATALMSGCGSGGPASSATTNRSQPSTAAQSTEEEPAAPAPAGASARSCTGGEAGIEGLRVTGADCGAGRAVAAAWSGDASCASPAAGSRFACSVRGYRCLGAATERGVAVSCSRPGRSIAFVARRG